MARDVLDDRSMSATQTLARHWRAFRDDAPGARFMNQYTRMRSEGPLALALAVVLGLLITAGGVVLLFIPGPGMLLVVFGLGLVASVSRPLARLLDRAEPALRRAARTAKDAWEAASIPAKIASSTAVVALAAGAALGAWHVWVS